MSLPQRIQALLSELGKEFEGMQNQLEVALEQSGRGRERDESEKNNHETLTMTGQDNSMLQEHALVPPATHSAPEPCLPKLPPAPQRLGGITPVGPRCQMTRLHPALSTDLATPELGFEYDSEVQSSMASPSAASELGEMDATDMESSEKHVESYGGEPSGFHESRPSLQGRSRGKSALKVTQMNSSASFTGMRSSASMASTAVIESGGIMSSSSVSSTESLSSTVSQSHAKKLSKRITFSGCKSRVSFQEATSNFCAFESLLNSFSASVSLRNRVAVVYAQDLKARRESGKPSNFKETLVVLVETIPPMVMIFNALTIGLSADIDPDSDAWKVLESTWIFVYFMEFLAKVFLYGFSTYFCGVERLWNIFDFTCLSVSLVDLAITYIFTFVAPSRSMIGLMKMLRLIRLLRLIRALNFPIFDELKQMVMGVGAGMRVLFWAVVLLFVIVFFVGVLVNNLMGDEEAELSTLPMAMLTVFRCYTDGCDAFDGTPLSSRLFEKYGASFFFGYILSFMFVTLGIFNLIMAIFIDNVVTRSLKKKLREIGSSVEQTRTVIEETLLMLIIEDDAFNTGILSDEVFMSPQKTIQRNEAPENDGPSEFAINVTAALADLQAQRFCISRDTFTKWLDHPDMSAMFSRAQIDVANHADLFDALDVDMVNELELSKLVNGLMTMRGPITKSDIVAMRLKTNHLVDQLEDVKESVDLVMSKLHNCLPHGSQSPSEKIRV